MRCLEKRAADRWQSADELLAQLEPLMTPSGGMTPAQTQPVAAIARSETVARHWPKVAIGIGVLVLATGALLLTRRSQSEPVLGRRTQVTLDPGLELDPALSPDGKLVAYTAGPSGLGRIFVRQLDGGGTIDLTAGASGDLRRPQWTPDASRIAFRSPRGIEIVPALGGKPKLLVAPAPDSVADLAWSPDGRRIVYRMGDSTFFVRAAEGGPARTLVAGPELHSPSWSPDGRWIAYVSGNPAYIYGLRSQLGNIAPSAIMVVPVDGGGPVQVTDRTSMNLSPVWLPAGRRLLFISNRDGGRDVYTVALSSTGKAEGPAHRITTGLNAATIGLSADGKRLVYAAFAQGANVWALTVPKGGPVSASSARPVTTGNQIIESIDVSRDGQWLVFDTDRTGNQDIFRMPIAGGEPEQLTSHPGDDFQPHFSPDGREIAFHGFRSGTRDLYVMSAAGGDEHPAMATRGQDRDPDWSPDGQQLVYDTDTTGRAEIYTIQRTGNGWGKPVRRTQDGGTFPLWSPDGRHLLFNAGNAVMLMRASGGEAVPLPMTGPLAGRSADAFAFAWAPDSRQVYAVVSSERPPFQTLWSVSIDGAAPRPVITFDDPLATFGRGVFAVRDSTIYFALLRSESDIWMAELGVR